MICEKVNLYTYFQKKQGKGGTLTVYAHENSIEINPNRTYPAMLVVHGGGYRGHSFREAEPVSLEFFVRGFNCFELDYDLSPFSYAYSPLTEGAMAMKFIRENAEKYNLNNQVCAIGFSAGGHLVSFLATAYDDVLFRDFFGNTEGIRPEAVILSYPVIAKDYPSASNCLNRLVDGDSAALERVSVERRVTRNSSPCYIWTTADDEYVDCMNSMLLAQKYRENGVPFSLHIFPSGQHGMSLCTDAVNKKGSGRIMCADMHTWLEEACLFLKGRGIDLSENDSDVRQKRDQS